MLKLVQTNWQEFDLAFDETASKNAEVDFASLIYAVLFTDAEASETYVSDRYERRGWWFDAEFGSLIWILRQQPLSAKTRQDTLNNITSALSSRSELSKVVVTDITPPGMVSSMQVSISAFYNDAQYYIELSI